MDPGGRPPVLIARPPLAPDRAGRVARAREELRRASVAGLILTPGPNLHYFSGLALAPSERLVALAIPTGGHPLLLTPAFERDRLANGLAIGADVVSWAEHENPFDKSRRLLSDGHWLLDPVTPFGIVARLQEAGLPLASAEQLCTTLRRRKDTAEIELLRAAQDLTRAILTDVREMLAPGITELELTEEILAGFRRAGADGWALVQFGARSSLPHGEPGRQALVEESPVLVDLGAVVEGYHGDLTRSWWFGANRPPRYAEVAAAVERAQTAAAGLVGAGTPAADLDRAARSLLAEHGLDAFFTHRLGHGVGLEIHEEPFLVQGNERPLESGEVFTIEPGVYLEGEFGYRHEDVWVVKGQSGVRLTSAEPESEGEQSAAV